MSDYSNNNLSFRSEVDATTVEEKILEELAHIPKMRCRQLNNLVISHLRPWLFFGYH